MLRKGADGANGAEGAEGAECSEGVWSTSIEPAEGVEPVRDQNAQKLPKIVQNPKIAELCNVIACNNSFLYCSMPVYCILA